VRAYVCAGAGFLLAVLWFDLMHDVQVLRPRPGADAAEAVRSIARYYRRVTTDARPLNRLVAAVMVATLAAIVIEILSGGVAAWVAWTSLVLTGAAISLAAARTVKNAVALGAYVDDLTPAREVVARSIGHDHVICFCAIAAVLIVQLAA
jgi:ER membrane protein SH3